MRFCELFLCPPRLSLSLSLSLSLPLSYIYIIDVHMITFVCSYITGEGHSEDDLHSLHIDLLQKVARGEVERRCLEDQIAVLSRIVENKKM